MPGQCPFELAGQGEQRRFSAEVGRQLHSNRQPVRSDAEGKADCRGTGQVEQGCE
jgi:hypothetical protein